MEQRHDDRSRHSRRPLQPGNAINLSGEVVGWADLKTGFSDSTLWNGKTAVDLGGTGLSGADGINDVGQMSGTCGSHACTLSNGTLTQLPNPSNVAGCNGGPINNSGEVM